MDTFQSRNATGQDTTKAAVDGVVATTQTGLMRGQCTQQLILRVYSERICISSSLNVPLRNRSESRHESFETAGETKETLPPLAASPHYIPRWEPQLDPEVCSRDGAFYPTASTAASREAARGPRIHLAG